QALWRSQYTELRGSMRQAILATTILVIATSVLAQDSSQHRQKQSEKAPRTNQPSTDTLQVTTSSEEARALYEAGIASWESLQLDAALKRWRTAANPPAGIRDRRH